ncbi:MAG: cation diffusion facilitator family transporter [Terriglobales bacterium]
MIPTADHKPHSHAHHVGVDPTITTSARGIWAVKWSFIGLTATAAVQVIVVVLSGSVALLADTIHNFGDAATAIPLGVAFMFARKKASPRFPFGYGRVEDLAGVLVVLTILFSAVVAGYEAIERLMHPRVVQHLGAVAAASVIGFLGNEGVAVLRIKVGKEIDTNLSLVATSGCLARDSGLACPQCGQ